MSLLSAISTVLRFLLLLVVPGVLGLVVWLFTAIDLLRAHVAPAIGRSDRRRNAEGTLGDDFGHTLDRYAPLPSENTRYSCNVKSDIHGSAALGDASAFSMVRGRDP